MRTRISSSLVVLASLALGACTSDGGGGSRDAGANPDGAGTDTGGSGGSDASTGDGGSGGRGGSTAAGGTTARGGSTGTGGHGGTMPADSGAERDGGSSACSVSGMDILSDDSHELSGLSFAGDRLAFLSSDLSLSNAPTIDTVHTDGTGRTTLHTPTGQRRVHDLLVHGAKVYFLELNEDVVPMEELFSVPVTGGSATRLGTATFDGARFVGADDANLFLVWDTAQPVGAVFARVDETSGAKATAATLTNVSTPFYPQLSGDSIFFVDSTTGATTQVNAYGFPKAGANVTPTLLWTADTQHDTCYLAIGGLTATPTKLLCGLFGVESHARTGGSATVVVPKDLTMRANEVVASDGENVYLDTPPASATGVGSLHRVASTGGAITPIACDVHTLENRIADGLAPIQNEYEVIVGGDQLYWIEKSNGTSNTWTIRHAAK